MELRFLCIMSIPDGLCRHAERKLLLRQHTMNLEQEIIKQRGIPMEKENLICPICGPLAAQTKEPLNGSYRQYDQILRRLMELERQGCMELFAGDCPLEDTDAVLDAEQHYTVCHYVRCRRCSALYFVGACIRGAPVFRQVTDIRKENLGTRLWGRCGTCFSQGKG